MSYCHYKKNGERYMRSKLTVWDNAREKEKIIFVIKARALPTTLTLAREPEWDRH